MHKAFPSSYRARRRATRAPSSIRHSPQPIDLRPICKIHDSNPLGRCPPDPATPLYESFAWLRFDPGLPIIAPLAISDGFDQLKRTPKLVRAPYMASAVFLSPQPCRFTRPSAARAPLSRHLNRRVLLGRTASSKPAASGGKPSLQSRNVNRGPLKKSQDAKLRSSKKTSDVKRVPPKKTPGVKSRPREGESRGQAHAVLRESIGHTQAASQTLKTPAGHLRKAGAQNQQTTWLNSNEFRQNGGRQYDHSSETTSLPCPT